MKTNALLLRPFFALLVVSLCASNSSLANNGYGHALSGGTTSKVLPKDRHILSHPVANIGMMEGLDFQVGKSVFEKFWVFAPSSTTASDGLGPLYNARSCARCHDQNGRSLAPFSLNKAENDYQVRPVDIFLRLSVPPSKRQFEEISANKIPFVPEPTYGAQLQGFASPGLPAEGYIKLTYTTLPFQLNGEQAAELQQPHYKITNLGYGPLHPKTLQSPRVAPAMIGLGLLENIADEALEALADPDDLKKDGISGRLRLTKNIKTGETAIGRFGWKAGAPDLEHQNAAAFVHDLGIGNPLFPQAWGDCTPKQSACRQQPHGNTDRHDKLEASQKMADILLLYTRLISVPARTDIDHDKVRLGGKLFDQIGCASCHHPNFRTREDATHPALAGQDIWPFSDLLIHDMGEGLADHRPEGNASGREWRTSPLWGLGADKMLAERLGKPVHYLHDGRARSLTEAILWHGGEASQSQQAFANLSRHQRLALIKFLESL